MQVGMQSKPNRQNRPGRAGAGRLSRAVDGFVRGEA